MQADLFLIIGVVLTGLAFPLALSALLERKIALGAWCCSAVGAAFIYVGHTGGPEVPFGLTSVADATIRVAAAVWR